MRNRLMHFSITDILENDPMHESQHDSFVNKSFTVSGNRDHVSTFSEQLDEYMSDIENGLLETVIEHKQHSLKERDRTVG